MVWVAFDANIVPNKSNQPLKEKHFLEHLFIGIRYHLNVACFYFKENNTNL